MARKIQRLTSYSLLFNGSSDGLTVPVKPSTTNFNIAFWIFLYPITNNSRVIDYQAAGPSGGFTIVLSSTNKKADFVINNGGSEVARISASMGIGEWVHFSLVFTTNSFKVYKNAILAGSDTNCTMSDPNVTLTIGKRATGATNFSKFLMEDFVLHNSIPWTQSQISALYTHGTVPTGVDVVYNFDASVTDSSGNNNDGTLSGGNYEAGLLPFTRARLPKFSNMLNFALGATKKVSVSDASIIRLETGNEFSLSSWIYLFNTRENVLPRFLEKGAHYNCFMGDQTNGQRNRVALEIVGSNEVATEYWGSTRLQPNRWYHIVTIFDNVSGYHYINGEPEKILTLAGPYVTGMVSTVGSDLIIGNTSGDDRNLPGVMSEVRQYNTVLTQDEIRQLYCGIDITRGLVGKWKLNEGTGEPMDSSGYDNNGTVTGALWDSLVYNRASAGGRTVATSRTTT